MSEILTMNLKTLNERLEAASLAGGKASQLERKIRLIKENGFSVTPKGTLEYITADLSQEAVTAIQDSILSDLHKQLEEATEEFHKTLLGGNEQ